MKSRKSLIILFLIVSLVALLLLLLNQYNQNLIQQDEFYNPHHLGGPHYLGGFSINTPERAANAATEGVQVVFDYGQPPSENERIGQKLQSLKMKVIDGYIYSYLYFYECHRIANLQPSLLGPGQYCHKDVHPSLTDANALLAAITAHLKQVKDNHLIIGYWVLDDWVHWDAGSARPLLIKIHQLIQQYTPDRPAICGFGGSIGLHQDFEWNDWVADNFSPQGCDEVGFYIYTSSLPDTTPTESPNTYNWSMQGVLPAMFASLQKRGWNITKESLIGIGQAFGGPIAGTDRYWVTPNAKDIETQSRSFCEHGATGLVFYAWNDAEFGPATQTPVNNSQIETGIRNGIAACKQYWSDHL